MLSDYRLAPVEVKFKERLLHVFVRAGITLEKFNVSTEVTLVEEERVLLLNSELQLRLSRYCMLQRLQYNVFIVVTSAAAYVTTSMLARHMYRQYMRRERLCVRSCRRAWMNKYR